MEVEAISLFEPECGAREIKLVTAALPLHTLLDEGQIQYINKTMNDTASNVGASAAI